MNKTKNTKSTLKERFSWYMYDWANSAFYTTVITVFLGPYLTGIAKAASDSGGMVYPLGIPVYHGSLFPFVVSLSVILQVLVLPLVGALADYSQAKKQLMLAFAYLGAFSAMGLYFLNGTNYMLGCILFIISNIGFGASVVMYNAYLIDISEPEDRDRVSSTGWAWGYLGGGLLLAANLYLFSNAESYGLSTGMAVRISLASAGAWWALFTLFPLIFLKRRKPVKQIQKGQNILTIGFREIYKTIKEARKYPKTLFFLLTYLIYNDGVQAVIAMSSQFGNVELKLDIAVLTKVILLVQFVAFLGSLLFRYLSKYFDTKKLIMASLVVWIMCLLYSYAFLKGETDFYFLAGCIAIVLGGTQALSRSLYSLVIPEGREAEYFSLYELSERGTSWLGPFLFAIALQVTFSYRIALLSLILFFLAGFFMLFKVNIGQAAQEVMVKAKN